MQDVNNHDASRTLHTIRRGSRTFASDCSRIRAQVMLWSLRASYGMTFGNLGAPWQSSRERCVRWIQPLFLGSRSRAVEQTRTSGFKESFLRYSASFGA
jgi:hypothetical protein